MAFCQPIIFSLEMKFVLFHVAYKLVIWQIYFFYCHFKVFLRNRVLMKIRLIEKFCCPFVNIYISFFIRHFLIKSVSQIGKTDQNFVPTNRKYLIYDWFWYRVSINRLRDIGFIFLSLITYLIITCLFLHKIKNKAILERLVNSYLLLPLLGEPFVGVKYLHVVLGIDL